MTDGVSLLPRFRNEPCVVNLCALPTRGNTSDTVVLQVLYLVCAACTRDGQLSYLIPVFGSKL
jgi:hypothetical protein